MEITEAMLVLLQAEGSKGVEFLMPKQDEIQQI